MMKEDNYEVECISYPDDKDWLLCKQVTLNTVGKNTTKLPTESFKRMILQSEHSPIRTLQYVFKITMPYWVSVHFVRHKFGVEHYVSTQRQDRNPTVKDRDSQPQGALVSHIMYINAQELMQMSRRRLCRMASPETRHVMTMIVKKAISVTPEFDGLLVPMCEYRNGLCSEPNCCGYNKIYKELIDEKYLKEKFGSKMTKHYIQDELFPKVSYYYSLVNEGIIGEKNRREIGKELEEGETFLYDCKNLIDEKDNIKNQTLRDTITILEVFYKRINGYMKSIDEFLELNRTIINEISEYKPILKEMRLANKGVLKDELLSKFKNDISEMLDKLIDANFIYIDSNDLYHLTFKGEKNSW